MSNTDEPIRQHEVGRYAELCERPNPDELVILTVPPFEEILPVIIEKAGRELSSDEIEAEKRNAPSIVLTKDEAENMAAARANRT